MVQADNVAMRADRDGRRFAHDFCAQLYMRTASLASTRHAYMSLDESN